MSSPTLTDVKAKLENAETVPAASSCDAVEPLLVAGAVASLHGPARAILARHLANCVACCRLAEELDRPSVVNLLAGLADDESSRAHERDDVVAERYRVVRFLGKGGMGEVYEVEDLLLKERVALKTLSAAFAFREKKIALLKRETNLARKITHPNVCRTFEFGLHARGDRSTVFFTMELLDGETLSTRLRRVGRLAPGDALPIAEQIIAGLGAAHAAGVIHRDLKCGNIMLVDAREGSRAVITDLGLASIAVDDDSESGESLAGTPAYMAPEQVEGGHRLTTACDVYALGVVLYEMVTGRLPFVDETPLGAAMLRLREPPPPPTSIVPELDPRWERAILACLERAPEARPADAGEVLRILRPPPRRAALTVAGAAIALLGCLAWWQWSDRTRAQWARETATPEIERLVEAERYAEATDLARRARAVLPGDRTLERLWRRATFEVSIDSTPPGAQVLYRRYRSDPQSWVPLGTTPLAKAAVPRDLYVWQVSRPGWAPALRIAPESDALPTEDAALELSVRLVPADAMPAGMVAVPGGPVTIVVPGLGTQLRAAVDDFFIDRHEVTNAEYRAFVEAGGYRRPELWKVPFVRDGAAVGWSEAMSAFRDSTGRPGPSTWADGTYPPGQDDFPVGGVSFYEAAAYAELKGKSLPTMYHFSRAAQTDAGTSIVVGSNFDASAPVAIEGAGAMSGFGTYDMAGNVKEWCLNEGTDGKRYIAGGGFDEPRYMFVVPDALSPWTRTRATGFRTVLLASPPPRELTAPIADPSRDFRADIASDETFAAYRRLYAYDRTPLNARVDSVDDGGEWRIERVSFDAAYNGERMGATLYLPKNARPPFHTVVYFPGSSALFFSSYDISPTADFIVRGGRALLVPIYKGMWQRRDGLKEPDPRPTRFFRDHMIAWSNDVGRSIDYLETRADIDHGGVAYLGFSWGAAVGPVLLATNDRFKVAILEAGGFFEQKALPEAEAANFAGRVRTPVLMLNGRYDNFFSFERSQKPLFDMMGTPAAQKRHVVFDSGHIPPRAQAVVEAQRWLDTYLGPVAGSGGR